MTTTGPRTLLGLFITLFALALLTVAQEMPRTTKEQIKGSATVTTEELSGTVVHVEGNRLVVQMSTGDLRTFDVPSSRRFIIDGREVTVDRLKAGTKLQATITTTTTPVTERTVTVGTARVWFVSGNNLILTLPNNENRMYKVEDTYRFTVGGQKATVHDLRKGMVISAEKIVESPLTQIASNTTVTGQAPQPPAPKVAVARAVPRPAPAPAPPPTAAAPQPPPEPAPTPEPTPAPELPKTASSVPLIGLLGVLFIGSSLVARRLRRL